MLVVLGFFVVFPLIYCFVDQMGWGCRHGRYRSRSTPVYSARSGYFRRAIADRFGAKPMIVTGMLMRAAGFATMGISPTNRGYCGFHACSGLGGTLFDPPRSALVVKLIRPQTNVVVFCC